MWICIIWRFGGMGDRFDSIVPPIQLWINYAFGGMRLKIEMNPKDTLCISQLNINFKVPFLVIEIRIITCKPCDEPLFIFNMHSFFLFLTLTLFFFLFLRYLQLEQPKHLPHSCYYCSWNKGKRYCY
jgi:hypothetical protein